ncbi:MAG: oligosaccharide flippase family protein [Dehalococcoidia bacterium]|nr:oligosaccharide flippase family protein [Dehalococcoidia bacterium]
MRSPRLGGDITTPPTPQGPAERFGARVVRGSLGIAGASYFTVVVGFLANLLMTRLLAPEAFGVVALATFFFSLLHVRTKVDVLRGYVQWPGSDGAGLGTAAALELAGALLTVLLTLLLALLLPLLGYPSDVAVVAVALAGIGVVESAGGIPGALLDKRLQFGRGSLMTAIALPLSYLPAFAAALLGAGYWSLVIQLGTQAGIYCLGMWWLARGPVGDAWRDGWRLSAPLARRLLSFGATWGLGSLAATLIGQLDNFLIGTAVSLEELGYYDRAYRIALWPSVLVSGIISRTAYVAYARLHADPARLARAANLTLWFMLRAIFLIGTVLLAAAPSVVELLYGPRWAPAALFLRVLIAMSLLRPMTEELATLLGAVGRPRRAALAAWTGALTLLGAGLPLTLLGGAVGTAVAVGVAYLVAATLASRLVLPLVPIAFGEVAVPAAAAFLAGGAAGLAVSATVASAAGEVFLPLRFALEAGLAAAAFIGVLLLLERRRLVARARDAVRLARSGTAS